MNIKRKLHYFSIWSRIRVMLVQHPELNYLFEYEMRYLKMEGYKI